MRCSIDEWAFPDQRLDQDIQSPGTQRKGDMDELLSQVGTWPVDSRYEFKPGSRGRGMTQSQRRHEATTKTKNASIIGPWF